ncbi:MAG: phosphatidate cytidylyltransferase [Planctomycetia bacterium]|nr:phosphatidate cytidylyltransferase [Planctomycetia bacterium]
MLRWRLLIGLPLTAIVVGMCWLDAYLPVPGLILMPFFLVCVFFLCKETMYLLNAGGIYPRRSTIYLGVFGTILLCWISCCNSLPFIARFEQSLVVAMQSEESQNHFVAPARQESEQAEEDANSITVAKAAVEASRRALAAAERALELARTHGRRDKYEVSSSGQAPGEANTTSLFQFSTEQEWKTAAFACVHILLAIAAGVLIAFVGEMLRFKLPGGHMINLSGAVFAIIYIGALGSFLVILRVAYGVIAVVSMILVTKMCDVGAYTVGRLIGRHKMAPSLSPGKTIEGAFGGLTFSILAAWFSTAVLFPLASNAKPQTTWLGIVVYGLAVGLTGMLGDLAESLIKRDAMRKDSGVNVPGFGGFLDIFDSLLLAAPVAFGLWAFHVVRY